jgi:hypothetical protein
VPRAWQSIAAQARGWPQTTTPITIGTPVTVRALPAARMRDAIGMNVDLWRTHDGYADFRAVMRRIRQLHLRHARVGMQSGPEYGLARMQQLGRAGVRLDVVMGDAYGRFGTTPFAALARRLQQTVLPYVDAVEGTNEPDLTRRSNWVSVARTHQRRVVDTVRRVRGWPVGVLAPSVGRLASLPAVGDMRDLADAANAHVYASGGEPSQALDRWLAATQMQRPGGPIVITETGFQTDLRQRKYHTPTSERAAAAYLPRTILEAIGRGIPQVYVYELVDRWSDPFGIDTAAHFGVLNHDLSPKPAWLALVRLQRALLDGGRPDRSVQDVRATVVRAPPDLRVLAFRRVDGTLTLALWRTVSVWDAQLGSDIAVDGAPVQLAVAASTGGALMTDVVTGRRRRLPPGGLINASLTGAPVVITGLQPVR